MKTKKTPLAQEKLDPVLLRTALVLVIGTLAPLLDSTMVNVAVHTIAAEMHASIASVQWITTGYVLAMALAVPLSGWATKRFGGKHTYVFSLAVFLAGSVCTMLSQNIGGMIVSRLVQGIGAGLLMPTMQTELVQISGGRNIGRIMAIISIPALLGPILGPVLGGVIVSAAGWRAIFWVNIPVCAAAVVSALWGIPADTQTDKRAQLDVPGMLLLSPAFCALIYGIVRMSSRGGITEYTVYVPLAAGTGLMAGYVVYALHTRREPVLNLRLFTSGNFSASNILLLFSGIITNGAMFILPLYFQEVRGAAATAAGLWLLPQGIGMLLTRSLAAKEAERNGSRPIVLLSLAAIFAGTLPFAFAAPDTNPVLLAAALLVRGSGLGGLFIAIMLSAYTGIDKASVPHASISTRIFQTAGGAFGSAILAIVLERHTGPQGASDIRAVSDAFNVTFLWSAGLTAAAALPALFLAKTGSSRETC